MSSPSNITPKQALELAISKAGNQTKLAQQLGVPHSTLWTWLNRDGQISAKYAHEAEKLTGVPAYQLRPDVFPVPEAAE